MSEAEMLSQINSVGELLWSLMQYWTSVSIAVLIGSHFVASRLNAIVIALFLLIYVLFTLQIGLLLRLQMYALQGLAMDLRLLADSGVSLSNTATNWLKYAPVANDSLLGQLSRQVMASAMFVATIFYPIYCKRKASD